MFPAGLTNNGRLNLINSTVTGSVASAGAPITMVGSNSFASDLGAELELRIEIRDSEGGHDTLSGGGQLDLDGALLVTATVSFAAPSNPGDHDEFTLATAADVAGTFDSVVYDGTSLIPSFGPDGDGSFRSHVGDGLFRILQYSGSDVTLINYFALMGDANGDRVVDELDFVVWDTHKFTFGTDWITGDFNADGRTDVRDLNLWNINRGMSVAQLATVPEPGGVVLLGAGVLVLGNLLARQRCLEIVVCSK